MKIAIVNKFFFLKGGQETLMFEEAKLLEQAGNEIAFFSMHHPNNTSDYKYNKYFVDQVEFSNLGKEYSLFQKLKFANNFIYNNQAIVKFEAFINDFKPNVIHCHGIAHQITYSILSAAKKYKIPVVQTLHDYQLICPCYTLLKGSKKVCDVENCSSSFYINCITNKCVKTSIGASILSSAEMIFNHKINKLSSYIDKYICPSNFLMNKMINNGLPAEKFVHIPNFINGIDRIQPEFNNQGYFLFFGRLSYEKGLLTLLNAFKKMESCNLKIVGTGPIEKELIIFKEENNINNVEFVGFQSGDNLTNLIKNSIAVILPAEWHENAPMSIIESFAYGKPVIATNLGGSPEMIKEAETGYLFNPSNIKELKEKCLLFIEQPNLAANLGKNARNFALKNYNSQIHMEKLLRVYNN